MPSIEMLRLVKFSTEAVMSAIRAARGFTKKGIKIVKIRGAVYHGHSDGLLVKGGSGLLTNSIPNAQVCRSIQTQLCLQSITMKNPCEQLL